MDGDFRRAETSRRGFLKIVGGAGIGLVVGFALPGGPIARAGGSGAAAEFNPFVRIAPDGRVTVIVKHLDKGQGVLTGLTTLVAEELDADWSQMKAEFAPADHTKYNNLHWGPYQGTGGSTAIANSWEQYREAGAVARALLVAAAAKAWGVPADEITVEAGRIAHGSGRAAGFGELAEAAAALPAPDKVALKAPADFRLIGSEEVRRLDSAAKTDGSAVFTIDLRRPGQLTAVLARPPRFGGTVKAFDAAAAKAVKGVVEVVEVPRGVAVIAETTWAAIQGRDALTVEWDESAAETRGSEQIMEQYRALAGKPGAPVRIEGDAEGAIAGADSVLEADYEFPFLAHATMEPINAVAEIRNGKVEVWTGSQLQTVDQITAAKIAGVEQQDAIINTLIAGGSFGRRATPDADMVAEAVSVAKALGGRPVQVQWTREDDIRGGRYRPAYVHRLRAGLDGDGRLVGWQHRIVGQSIVKGTPFEGGLVKDGIDMTSVEGAQNLPYAIPNFQLELHTTDVRVPVLWWRSVGSTHTAYSTETFIDALAEAAGRDPVDFRLALLGEHPRHRGVLELAADKAGWGGALGEGLHRGVAVHESFNSYVAQVAEVRIRDDGTVKVERVVCAVDCGVAVNPDQVRAQMEGGIGYGLGAALRNRVTLTDGRVEQSNFHDYEPLRMSDMPRIEVHIVRSAAHPTGVGEPGTPVIAPAVANAVFRATGQRITRLPFSLTELRTA